MKCLITRTSLYADAEYSPVEGAELEYYGVVDIHGIENQWPRWFIYLDTLEQLRELSERLGELLVVGPVFPDGLEIEIYDDYRE